MVNQHAAEPTHVRFSKYESKYAAHQAHLKADPVLAQVLEVGYCVIPSFWSPKQCAQARQLIDNMLEPSSAQKIKVWHDPKDADKRIMGANHLSSKLDLFTNEQIDAWIKSLYGVEQLVGFTMAARLDALNGNLGSGQGWHRDSCVEHQYKAILYLSDVDAAHGPFQYYRASGNASDIIKFEQSTQIPVDQNRLGDFENKLNWDEIDELAGNQGTLIIANTRGIHRGKPIESGCRYALTNYYWKRQIPAHIAGFVNTPQCENEH